MTIDAFVEQLAGLDLTWEMGRSGRIRTVINEGALTCPLCALDGCGGVAVEEPARRLGLALNVAEKLVDAADNCVLAAHFDPALRQRLLLACKLSTAKDGNVAGSAEDPLRPGEGRSDPATFPTGGGE